MKHKSVLILLVGIYLIDSAGAASCGDILTNDTTLTTNMTCNGTALLIWGDDVTLDCGGHWIVGNGTFNGVEVNNRSGVTVANCTFLNFQTGVLVYSSNTSNVLSNTVRNNSLCGVFLYGGANDNTVHSNTVSDNLYGICVHNSSGVNVSGNILSNNSQAGLYVYESSTNGTFSDNAFSSHPSRGVFISQSDDNTISGNALNDSEEAIELHSSSFNRISDNTVRHGSYGLYIWSSSNNNNATDNYVLNNSNGVAITSSTGNYATNNTLVNCTDGMDLDRANNNTLTGNTVYNSNDAGIELHSSNYTTLSNNTVNVTELVGIWLYDSVGATLTDNSLHNAGLYLWGETIDNYISHTIDTSNTANGKPIRYLKNINHTTVPSNTGQAILVNSTNVTVENLNISNVTTAVQIVYSSNCTIRNNNLSNNIYYGILIENSGGNTVTGNSVNDMTYSAIILASSDSNVISGNNASNSLYGVGLTSSNNNTLASNIANANRQGNFILENSFDNTLTNNTGNNSQWYGFYVYSGSSRNSLTGNTFCSNNLANSAFYDIADQVSANSGDNNTCDTTLNYTDSSAASACVNSCSSSSTESIALVLGWNLISISVGEIATTTTTTTTIASTIDLTVSEILMSQGVDTGLSPRQDLGAVTVPRIAGRGTVVRAFVEVTGDNGTVSNVSAKLYGELDGTPMSGSPLEATLGSVASSPSTDNWTHSLNFALPESWVVSGASFYLELDPDNEYPEFNESDNRVPSSGSIDFEFEDTPGFDLMIVPLIHDGRTPNTTAYSEIEEWVRWIYPAPNVSTEIHSTVTYNGTPVEPNGANWNDVLDFVTTLRGAETSLPDLYYYGVFDTGYASGVTGLGWTPYSPSSPMPVAVGTDNVSIAGKSAVHEIGHNHGRNHAPCGTPSGVDPNYPYPDGRIGVVGWKLNSTTLYDNTTYADVMSYCDNLWVSDYTYRALYNWDDNISGLDHSSTVGRVFYISGSIRDGGAVNVRAFDLPDHAETPDEGDYRLDLLDSGGAVILSRHFTTIPTDRIPGRSAFSVKVDRTNLDIGGYRVIGPDGRCLAEERRDGPPPAIESLRTERSTTGTATIKWKENSTHDLLRVVMVATAPEYRWEVRSMGESRTSLEWKEPKQEHGPVIVRVIISDGVRSDMLQTAF